MLLKMLLKMLRNCFARRWNYKDDMALYYLAINTKLGRSSYAAVVGAAVLPSVIVSEPWQIWAMQRSIQWGKLVLSFIGSTARPPLDKALRPSEDHKSLLLDIPCWRIPATSLDIKEAGAMAFAIIGDMFPSRHFATLMARILIKRTCGLQNHIFLFMLEAANRRSFES